MGTPNISSSEADGVALAAIQGLHQIVQNKDCEIEMLDSKLSNLKSEMSRFKSENARLKELEASLARLEALLQGHSTTEDKP